MPVTPALPRLDNTMADGITEFQVSYWNETLFLAPDETSAHIALSARQVARGRIWTAEEVRTLKKADATAEEVQTVTVTKAMFAGTVRGVGPDVPPRPPCVQAEPTFKKRQGLGGIKGGNRKNAPFPPPDWNPDAGIRCRHEKKTLTMVPRAA